MYTPPQGVYVPKFWYFLVLGPHTPAPIGVIFGVDESTLGRFLHAKCHPNRCNVSSLRGEKPQNRLRVTVRRLHAVLPVMTVGSVWWRKSNLLTAELVVAVRLVRTVGSPVTDPVTWDARLAVTTQEHVVSHTERVCITTISNRQYSQGPWPHILKVAQHIVCLAPHCLIPKQLMHIYSLFRK